jgi:hypothetical protein
VAWRDTTQLPPQNRVKLEGVSGRCLDMEIVFERQSALISGMMLQSWTSSQGSAAILYDWNSSQLEVCSQREFHTCNEFEFLCIAV